MDLYYDPVVDEHVSSPMGLMAPVWYLAPQRPDIARSAWELAIQLTGLDGTAEPSGLNDPGFASLLAMQTGEFDDGSVRERLWQALDKTHQPTWDRDRGEFTFGFGLDEPHPRGQLNARAMAGWVCTPGAWSRIFTGTSDSRFSQPTICGVDFPDVALSEARWDGSALYLAAQPRNSSMTNTRTSIQIEALPPNRSWTLVRPDGSTQMIEPATTTQLEVTVDGGRYEIRQEAR